VKVSQWLSSRAELSDWLTQNQAENKSRVILQWQSYSIVADPLFMAVWPSVVGLQTVASEMTQRSRFTAIGKFDLDDPMEDLWDVLATEDGLRPICDEETAEPLGVTIGRGET
jgi:hypothetical protein